MEYVKLGRVADFGSARIRSYTILGRHIGIVRNADGTFFATEISCKHQNADLSTGALKGNVVTCPRHGWRYDLATGECLNQKSARLRRHDLRIENGWFVVSALPIDAEEANGDADPFPEIQIRKRD